MEAGDDRSEVEVADVVVTPGRRCEDREAVQLLGPQLGDGVALVPASVKLRAVAARDVDVAVAAEHGTRRRPHPGFPGGRHGVVEGLPLAVCRGRGHVADVVVAVAGETSEGHDDPVVGDQHGGPLLLGLAVAMGEHVERRVPAPVPGGRGEGPQRVVSAHRLGDHEHRAGLRVVGRGAGDAERVDVAAGEPAHGLRASETGLPADVARARVEAEDLVRSVATISVVPTTSGSPYTAAPSFFDHACLRGPPTGAVACPARSGVRW